MNSKIYYPVVAALVLAPLTLSAQTVQATAQSRTQVQAQAQGQSQTQMQAQGNSQTQTQTQTQQPQGSSQARIDAAMQAAAHAKIPTALLQSKVAEGQAKHVPPQRIAAAVEARLSALLQADAAMDRADIASPSQAELSVAADALQAGVSQNALIKVYRDAPSERRVVAVAVLTDLVRLGQSSANAFARVSGALGSSAALANLQAQVASQLRLGGLGSTLDASGLVHVK